MMTDEDAQFALRLYADDQGTRSLLCREPEHKCPQWWYRPDNRILFASPADALAFLSSLRTEWPEFKENDVRVVRVVPMVPETYVEVARYEPAKDASSAAASASPPIAAKETCSCPHGIWDPRCPSHGRQSGPGRVIQGGRDAPAKPPCQTCGGAGRVDEAEATGATTFAVWSVPCPDCRPAAKQGS
jgi:hypothetical protein